MPTWMILGLLPYFGALAFIFTRLLRLCGRYQAQGQLGKAWAVCGIGIVLTIAHWTWPFLLLGGAR